MSYSKTYAKVQAQKVDPLLILGNIPDICRVGKVAQITLYFIFFKLALGSPSVGTVINDED